MRSPWTRLPQPDANVFRTTVAFIETRLESAQTIAWALELSSAQQAERYAVSEVLSLKARSLAEPWRSAWRYIEDHWGSEVTEADYDAGLADVAERLTMGERSASVVDALVTLVRPSLAVSKMSELERAHRPGRRRPRSVHDLMSLKLESGRLTFPAELHLEQVSEQSFLMDLAAALDAAVARGLAISDRALGPVSDAFWRLGDLARTYFLAGEQADNDPDSFHRGIAPSVKLLEYVVERLEPRHARTFAMKWAASPGPVYLRLWAAAARSGDLANGSEVAHQLASTSDREFWDLYRYPEVSEVRARRFGDLPADDQLVILRRLMKAPPSSFWPAESNKEEVRGARDYWKFRELRRVAIAGNQLPAAQLEWMEANAHRFPALSQMQIDEGFREAIKADWVRPKPDDRYEFVSGLPRLQMLESALSSKRNGWDDDPAGRASDWMGAEQNASKLIADLESAGRRAGDFPAVWERFGWAHKPSKDEPSVQDVSDGERVLALLLDLPETTASVSIEGISEWLDKWARPLRGDERFKLAWLRFWPTAESYTNSQDDGSEPSLSVVVRGSSEDEPHDLDTLNTPAGKFVGALLGACPTIRSREDKPFENELLKKMLDRAVAARGRSLLIAHHRFIEQMPYFLRADLDWTMRELVHPLLEDSDRSFVLWRAVARSARTPEVLRVLGRTMAKKAVDLKLGRETRRSLAFSLVVESLHAFRESRKPAVPEEEVLQMLRLLDDEVRAFAANVLPRFVNELSASKRESFRPDDLFRKAVEPFLERVWPHDKTLVTPAVAKALARLPAAAGTAFAEAANAVEPFLVPFDAWSLRDYGLYGDDADSPMLGRIDSLEKARSFLHLLDATVSPKEGAVVPLDLDRALEHIENVAPRLTDEKTFRRLATLARR